MTARRLPIRWTAATASLLLPVAAASACGTTAHGVVTDVVDARTLRLEDGWSVRLAAVDVPPEAGEPARAFLLETLKGRAIRLAVVKARDRYGRTEAFVMIGTQDLDRPVQQAMVERGLVRVSARWGDRACASGFLASEAEARQARRGLWADARWGVRQADDPAGIAALRGGFAVVEGRVASVRESGGTIYVNFGRRWKEDFTVTVAKRNERALAAAGLDVRRLDRQTVRVRGYVEERGGPWIDVTHAEQIELVQP